MNIELEAGNYEMLIRRAHSCEKGTKHGADRAYMKNLMMTEAGQKRGKDSYEKQIAAMRKYLHSALEKMLKNKELKTVKDQIASLQSKVDACASSSSLMQVVSAALALWEDGQEAHHLDNYEL
jgi:hypothetical protein